MGGKSYNVMRFFALMGLLMAGCGNRAAKMGGNMGTIAESRNEFNGNMAAEGPGEMPGTAIVDDELDASDTEEQGKSMVSVAGNDAAVQGEESNRKTVFLTDGWGGTKAEPEVIYMDNPSWEYFYNGAAGPAGPDQSPLQLIKLKEEPNGITDTEEWFADNGLILESEKSEDERYICQILPGADGREAYRVQVTDRENETVCIFDFGEYQYADEFKPEDRDFVKQCVRYILIKDGVLYVSIGHLTYAESSSHNAYVAAVDLSGKKLLWKSQPLVSNAGNFAISGDVLICGYGFTSEPDYLYQLDLASGRVISQLSIKSKADYLILKDSALYVRTYNTDYVFQVKNRVKD